MQPWREERGLWPSDWVNSFFDDGFFRPFQPFDGGMKADIRETDDSYLIDVEVPGMSKDNLDIELNDNVLTVTAQIEDKKDEKDKEGRYIRRERRSGMFRRSFVLDNVKVADLDAKMDNGVLTIVCPKEEAKVSKNKKIDIR